MTSHRASEPTDDQSFADTADSAETIETTSTTAFVEPTSETPSRRRAVVRRPAVLVAAGLVLVLTAGGAVAASAHKTIQIDVDGQTRSVSTFAGSVDGVLAQAGVAVAERDAVTPAGDTALADGADVVVRHANPLDVSIDGRTQTIWTTALTATEALGDLEASGRDASIVASRSASGGRAVIDLPLATMGPVTVTVDGATTLVPLDGATTVEQLLEVAGITLGELDRVVVDATPEGKPTVVVSRVTRGERVETIAVAHATSEQNDDTRYTGTRRVVQAGVDGAVQRTFRTLTVDGVEVSATLTSEAATAAAVDEIVAVGTKARPAATSSSSTTSAPAPAPAPASTSVGTGIWAALAKCESGGNPGAVSSNGLYYGLYQFSVGTWQAMGGSGLPSQASAAEQTQRAQALQARSGWGQWPACARSLGLI